MGFTTVTHRISISRAELVNLLIDGVVVDCRNQHGESVKIYSPSSHTRNGFGSSGRTQTHDFVASVNHGGRSFSRAKLTLTTTDFKHYTGTVEYEKYPDDNVSE